MSECQKKLINEGKPYPRTCPVCGLGPCQELSPSDNESHITMLTDVEKIAKVCHEVNRAYCISIGDNSQLPWDDSPDWQKESARKGVQFHIRNPDAGPEASHASWLEEKKATGWKYGAVKNVEKKEHPCFVFYHELPKEQRTKDLLFVAVVRTMTGD